MPLLDERGRLFGKVNLIDAAVAAFVLVLIPLTYAAYLLFKAPTPVITSLTPQTVAVAKGAALELKGEHLRPFFRAFLGPTPVEYLFASPDRAVLTLPELPPGAYELTLYDEAQVIAKGPSVSVSPPADLGATVLAIGTFNRLQASEAAAIQVGLKLPAAAGATPTSTPAEMVEILGTRSPSAVHVPPEPTAASMADVGERQQLVAVVRLHGRLAGRDLLVGATKISPSAELALPLAVGAASVGAKDAAAPAEAKRVRQVTFTVQRVYPARPTRVDVRVRIIARPEVLKVAQRHITQAQHDPFESLLPQLLSAKVTEELEGDTKLDRREGRIVIVDAIVRLPAVSTTDGWSYDNKLLRPGVELVIDTPHWQMGGTVLSVEPRGRDD